MTPTDIQIFGNNVKIVIVRYMFLLLLDDWYKTGIRDTMCKDLWLLFFDSQSAEQFAVVFLVYPLM